MGLSLSASFDPPRVTSGDLQPLTLRLILTNTGDKPLPLYTSTAVYDFVGGWGSPVWTFAAQRGSAVHFLAFSKYHGPPGMPPAAECFESHRKDLAPGASEDHSCQGCFIPPNLLGEHLSAPVLGEGWRRLPEFAPDTGVWLMEHDPAWVRQAMAERVDFLLPQDRFTHMVFFLPRGRLELDISYRQEPFMAWKPRQNLSATAKAVLEHAG